MELLAGVNMQIKEKRNIQIGKEEVKLSLFVDGMISYIVNPKNLLKTIRTYKRIEQDCRVQGQYAKIHHILIP